MHVFLRQVWDVWCWWGRTFFLLAGGILCVDAIWHAIADHPTPWLKAMFEGFIGSLLILLGITLYLLLRTTKVQQEKVSND